MKRSELLNGYLFDSNIIVALLQNDPDVIELVKNSSKQGKAIYFSNISVCEIFSGIKQNEFKVIRKLFNTKRCLDVTLDISINAGNLRKSLKEEGRNIKTPDALIASTARLYELELVSRDKDFRSLSHGLANTL